MKAEKFETIITEFLDPEVYRIEYDLELLVIYFKANDHEDYMIKFDSVVAFKCLDERDMSDYWYDEVFTQNWILEVFEGGWFQMEKSRGMISHEVMEIREFLIAGIEDCLTILATDEPSIERIE